jgi:uncharacterized protein YdaU (DUF1376 family)
MKSAARSGYLYLLSSAWQTDDCCLPDDDAELIVLAGMADEEWAQHGPTIRRRFVKTENGLRNEVEFEEWNEAKRVFESRQTNARRTNTKRTSSDERTESVRTASRNADTQTVTGTVTTTEKQEQAITPEMVTRSVLTELGLSGRDLAIVLDEVCRSQMKLYETPGALRDAMIAAWREYDVAKPRLGYTKGAAKFFGDGDWRNKEGWPWRPGESPPIRKPPGENKALQAIKEREEAVRRERGS